MAIGRKTGGRTKGTPNKNTGMAPLLLDSIGCNPLIELAQIAMHKDTPQETKVRIFSDLLQYVYPRRKAIDLNLPNGMDVNLHVGSAREALAARVASLAARSQQN